MTTWTFHDTGFPPPHVLQALAQACIPIRLPDTDAGRKTRWGREMYGTEVVDVPPPQWNEADRLPADLVDEPSDISADEIGAGVTPRRTWGANLSTDRAPGSYCLARCYCGQHPQYVPLPGVTYSPHLRRPAA